MTHLYVRHDSFICQDIRYCVHRAASERISRRRIAYERHTPCRKTCGRCNSYCDTLQQAATTCNKLPALKHTATTRHTATTLLAKRVAGATHCNILQHTATYCNNTTLCNNIKATLLGAKRVAGARNRPVAVCCSVLQCTAVCCSVVQCVAAKHCNTLQHTAAQCSTLQHTATTRHTATTSETNSLARNTWQVQHTATHCNNMTLQQHDTATTSNAHF